MITTLSGLIAAAESSNNQWAVRYEPAHVPVSNFVMSMMHAAQCNLATAEILCKCSWGLYQIMGDELISRGMAISPIDYCSDIPMQNLMLGKVLIEKKISTYTLSDILNDPTKRATFARLYNGPGAVDQYAEYLVDTYKKYS